MLYELHIRNFAIIDDLHLQFGPGLNILTGETGAGKSIILDAIGMLLGDRASADWVRAGTQRAEIEATFHVPALKHAQMDAEIRPEISTGMSSTMMSSTMMITQEVVDRLQAEDLDDPDNPEWVMLSREVRVSGRNTCRVNGRSTRLQILSEVASLLVDIHGQGEHLNLLNAKTHIHLIDRYAGIYHERDKVASKVRELRQVQSELKRLQQNERSIAQRLDLLNYQVDEIFEANLHPDEEQALEQERRRLSNAESLTALAQASQAILSEGDGEMPGAIDMVSDAEGRLERLARIDPDMQDVADEAQALVEQLGDLARTLQDYVDTLEYNPERLVEVEDRIDLIHSLQRKYGDTIAEIIAFGEEAQKELEALDNWEARTADLEEREEQLLHEIGEIAAVFSEKRTQAGEQLARQVEHELADLRMNKARFGVAVNQTEHPHGAYAPDGRRVTFDQTGYDQVEFMISANPGEPLMPMARVASGGETARLMLALKSVLAHADSTPTLIFDEIDQGIGGRVGSIVGQKLWQLTTVRSLEAQTNMMATAKNGKPKKKKSKKNEQAALFTLDTEQDKISHQVLCITHLPQLAAFGDQHFTVTKQVVMDDDEERTRTHVKQLTTEERVQELMQMLGAMTDAGRKSVEEMMDDVAKVKQG
ncbi:MAG: DNA repair protein RecN [Chloroflexota bacterium]